MVVKSHSLQNIYSQLSVFVDAATSLQSCPTLCDPIDSSPPGSPVPGILQARAPEWVAISFSNAWKWKVKVKSLSHVRLLATPWTADYQAPPSMGFFQARVLEWDAIAFSVFVNGNPQSQRAICTLQFYRGTWVLADFGIKGGPWNQYSVDTKGWLYK